MSVVVPVTYNFAERTGLSPTVTLLAADHATVLDGPHAMTLGGGTDYDGTVTLPDNFTYGWVRCDPGDSSSDGGDIPVDRSMFAELFVGGTASASPSFLAGLNARQKRAYKDLVDVWRKGSRTFSDTGAPTEASYSRVRTGMPGMWGYTQNDSDPTEVGRIKRRTALTEDNFHALVTEDVRDADVLVDVTILGDNSLSPNYATMARVQGDPRKLPTLGGRRVNALIVQTMSIPHSEWPAEIVAAY